MKVLLASSMHLSVEPPQAAVAERCDLRRSSARVSQRAMFAHRSSSLASQRTTAPESDFGESSIPRRCFQRLGQSVVGASRQRAAPRSQSLACLVTTRWRRLVLAEGAWPRLLSAFALRRSQLVVPRSESCLMNSPQPNPSVKRTGSGRPALAFISFSAKPVLPSPPLTSNVRLRKSNA